MANAQYGVMSTNRRHAVAALAAAGLLWGTTVPLSKVALSWLSPGWLTVARFGLAAAVLLVAARRRGPGGGALRNAFTPAVLAAGALGYGGSVMVQNAGIARTSVTHAALLIGAVPVLVAAIAAVWYRTVAPPVAWFGFVVSLGGVGLVTVGGGGGGATLAGDGLVLVSLLLSATVTVAQGRLLTGRDPVAVTAVQFLGATLGALPVAVLTEGTPTAPVGAGPVLAVVALALGGTLAPFTLFAFGQSRVSAEVAGAFLNLEPLVGAIAGAVAFGDKVGLVQVAGGLAILAGIGLSSLPLITGRRAEARREAQRHIVPVAGCQYRGGSGTSEPQVTRGMGASKRRGRPGGRAAGRPPARGRRPGRVTSGGGPGGSGRRATGGRGRSWPGASRGRSAAARWPRRAGTARRR
jgi:drug/metabolite transporter (DMT)-like permease